MEIVGYDCPSLHRDAWCLFCTPHGNANFPALHRRFRLKIKCHGFPEAYEHKYLFDHRLDRFDHGLNRFDRRLSKRCSALVCINTLADWSTFKSAAGTVPNSYPHSRACIKSNTHSYADSEPDTITKPSIHRNASPTFAPPQIALYPVQVIRVFDAAGYGRLEVLHRFLLRGIQRTRYRVLPGIPPVGSFHIDWIFGRFRLNTFNWLLYERSQQQ